MGTRTEVIMLIIPCITLFRIFCYTIPPGTYKEAEVCRAGSHYLHYTQTTWLEYRKVPAQQWLEPQATCSVGMPHGSHTLTGMEFLFAFYPTYISDFLWLKVNFLLYTPNFMHYSQSYSHDYCQNNQLTLEIMLYCNVWYSIRVLQCISLSKLLTVLLKYINLFSVTFWIIWIFVGFLWVFVNTMLGNNNSMCYAKNIPA